MFLIVSRISWTVWGNGYVVLLVLLLLSLLNSWLVVEICMISIYIWKIFSQFCRINLPSSFQDAVPMYIYANNFFSRMVWLWKSLAAKCSPLAYYFKYFKSGVTKYLSSFYSFEVSFPVQLIFVLFIVSPLKVD